MKGFTLIEIIIYLAISFFIFSSLFLLALNFINIQQKYFYETQLEKEKLFLKKKILWLLENSSNLQITTSTQYFRIDFSGGNFSQTQSLILNLGRLYLNNNLLTSRYDYSSSSVEILSLSPLGIRIYLQPKFLDYLQIRSKPLPLEIKFYYKNE